MWGTIIMIIVFIVFVAVGYIVLTDFQKVIDRCILQVCNCSSINDKVCFLECNQSCVVIGGIR